MESLAMSIFGDTYRGKRIFLTGHTGFKGSWLAEWLLMLGAEVHGYALDPQPHEVLFNQLGLADRLASDTRADLADQANLRKSFNGANPDVVFHLAAQPLVRLSYQIPVETFATNVIGTANVLEAVRVCNKPCVVVCVTTDKSYENREWVHSYREEDPMGGHDPYSASKGAAELVINSYRRSFFSCSASETPVIRLASARAGNVIGGGDWALDRIVPDCIRSLQRGDSIPVRNKLATRPWQHVLEPLSGYLQLAANLQLTTSPESLRHLCGGFNFGPSLMSNRTVVELVEELLKHWPGSWDDHTDTKAVHEATLLNLATDKSFHLLKWQPVWNFSQTIEQTISWYQRYSLDSTTAASLTVSQISNYMSEAKRLKIPWAQ